MESKPPDMTKKDRIREAVFESPWATQQEIADDVGASRSTVADVVSERPELQQVRQAFREGFELDATEGNLERLAAMDGVPGAVATRLRESADADDLDGIRIDLRVTKPDT